ncbi:MAG: hypothetical protein HQM14_05700 [SAR324 cluster bacterium]|nr:hypothetical protein [SAR324 cluster bacterium]
MVRIIILVVIGLVSFSAVFGLGYLFVIPKTDEPMQEQMGDMEPAPSEGMKPVPGGAVPPPPGDEPK